MARGAVVVKRLVFAAPGELTIPTGGYAYDRRIVMELRESGWRVDVLNLGEGFPFPSSDIRASAAMLLAALPMDRPVVIDGLAFGALPETARRLRASHHLIALVHHPLALETGLSSDAAAALRASETQALACARRVIATSGPTARLLVSDFGVPAERVAVVRPGNDRVSPARAGADGPIALLAVGAVTHRKGYDVLLAALAQLLDLRWRLTIVGDLGRDSDAVTRLHADIDRFNLADRVRVAGVVPAQRLLGLYASADLFVLASRFEGYGMALAEAIAHGVPVVGTTGGAVPETLPQDACLLTRPDDVGAFSIAVRRLIEDPAARRRFAAAARAAAAALPSWVDSARLFSQAIETAA
jgi:glycosyltransferase involved in cell wall biosynthesis